MATIQFSGLASGIDSASLIDAVIEAREAQNDSRKEEITRLEGENDALEEINTKLLALNDAIDAFRTANGGGVSKKSTSSDSTVATAAVSTSAINATYDLTVSAIASTATASFDDTYADTTTAMAANAVGTQTIGVLVGTGSNQVTVNVDIDSSTTIQQYVDSFNADSNASGRVAASLVNVGTTSTPSYKIVFNSLEEGTDLGTIAFSVPAAGAGFGGNSDLQTQTIDQATDASFSLTGIGTVTRATNSVSDVVSGITFSLTKAGTATITVSNDADSTADAFQEVVDAYNDIVDYINENDTVSETTENGETKIVYGTLAKSQLDDGFIQEFKDYFSAATSTAGTSVFGFQDLGLSTNRDGTLEFDTDTFKSAVGSDPTGATEVFRDFADDAAGINGFIYNYTKFDGYIDVAQSSNNDQITNLNDKIEQVERGSSQLRSTLEQIFARLETNMAALQSQQQQLTSILAAL